MLSNDGFKNAVKYLDVIEAAVLKLKDDWYNRLLITVTELAESSNIPYTDFIEVLGDESLSPDGRLRKIITMSGGDADAVFLNWQQRYDAAWEAFWSDFKNKN